MYIYIYMTESSVEGEYTNIVSCRKKREEVW